MPDSVGAPYLCIQELGQICPLFSIASREYFNILNYALASIMMIRLLVPFDENRKGKIIL